MDGKIIFNLISILIGLLLVLILFYPMTYSHLSSPPQNDDEINKIVSKHLLRKGLIKCTIPDTMKVGFSNRILVQIRHGTNKLISNRYEEELFFRGLGIRERQKAIEYLNTYSTIDSIKISSYVEVDLMDPKKKFILNPLFSKKLKVIDSLNYSTWQWEVEPKEKGKFPIIVNVSTRIYDGYEKNFDELKVFEKEVMIQSNQ